MSGEPEEPGGPGNEGDGRSSLARSLQKAGPILHMGWSIAISVTLGAGLGYWLDKHFGTSPWLLIAGSILGIAAGFVELIRVTSKLD